MHVQKGSGRSIAGSVSLSRSHHAGSGVVITHYPACIGQLNVAMIGSYVYISCGPDPSSVHVLHNSFACLHTPVGVIDIVTNIHHHHLPTLGLRDAAVAQCNVPLCSLIQSQSQPF